MTKIEWTEKSWNPIVGCSVTSPGCTNCYAMKMAYRLEHNFETPHYAGTTKMVNRNAVWTGQVNLAPNHILTAPIRRKRPTTYFVNSMSDLFHEDVPDEWIDTIFETIEWCDVRDLGHIFQILTKRSERMRDYMVKHYGYLGRGPSNCWLGVSAEDQKRADERIPYLLDTPAVVRFVSAEPLLGPIEFGCIYDQRENVRQINALEGRWYHLHDDDLEGTETGKIDWIIVGCESGPKRRPMNEDWVHFIKNQCAPPNVSTKFFYKQSIENGKIVKLPELDGRQWTQIPEIAANG